MMKKATLTILVIIGMAAVIVLSLKLLSNEDDWICVNGQWVKHGNPRAPMLTGGCGKKQV